MEIELLSLMELLGDNSLGHQMNPSDVNPSDVATQTPTRLDRINL